MHLSTRSLAWKQTRWTLVAAVFLGILLSFLMIIMDFKQTQANINTSTQELLRTLSNAATQAAYTLDKTLAEEVLEGLFAVQAITAGDLVTETGRTLASRQRTEEQKPPTLGRLLGTDRQFSHSLVHTPAFSNEQLKVGQLKVTLNPALAGREFASRIWWELFFGLVRNIVLAGVILLISKHLLTRPLSQLATQIHARKNDDFTPLNHLAHHKKDEIGQVVTAFNELLDSLHQSRHEMERLNEVMAHHFQEPARRLVIFTRRLESELDLPEGDTSRLSLQFIREQSLRLSNLVRDVQRFLALDQLKLPGKRVYPAQVFQEVLKERQSLLNPLRLDIRVEISGETVPAWFPPRRLKEIFTLLLDNALGYAVVEHQLQLQVDVWEEDQKIKVAFADGGPGIEPAYREQVFYIFERLVPSGQDYPGTGMGLAWIKKVLMHYGGQIQLTDTPLGGACFVFELPQQGVLNDDESNR